MVLDHAFDVEFFNRNHAEAVDQPPCCLMHEIMATVTNAFMDTSQDFIGFPAFTAPLFSLGLLSACFRQCFFVFAAGF